MTKFSHNTILLILTLLFCPFFSYAQNSIGSVNINLSPVNPGPNQTVSASVSTSEFNIDLAKIAWSVDDKIVKSGQGEKNFTFQSTSAGKTQIVSVSVTTSGRAPIVASVEVAPGGSMDLVWEAVDGYTPPFYRGKTLPIKQSAIKVVAIPNVKSSSGVAIKPGSFAYKWTKDGGNVPGQSGLGKNSLVFVNQILETSNRIGVSATNGTENVSASINIDPFTPDILFYEYDESLRIPKYQKALGQNSLIPKKRMLLVAEPYFLAKNFLNDAGTTLTWKINDVSARAGIKNMLGVDATTADQLKIEMTYDETRKLFRNFMSNLRLGTI